METKSSAYRFGEYLLEPDEHRLTHKDREIAVRPKNFQVLHCLLDHHGHLLTKESLLDSVWPDIFVTEKVLTQSISELRSALNDHGEAPRFIKTVPRVGYKFIGKVMKVAPEERSRESLSPIKPSIAVLPFRDMSPDRDQGYFCEGIAEEIINALTHVEGLRVVARTSAFSFKTSTVDIREIGERLNAYAVLEGAVRRSENNLRVSVQLVDAATGYHLWSEQYDRIVDDIFGVQSEIAVRVVDKLKLDIAGSRREAIQKSYTSSLEAYQCLLKGRYFMSREGREEQEKAAKYYRSAIAEDPEYALAYATLSICNLIMWTWDYAPQLEILLEAKRLATTAVELDENLGVAYSALGFSKMYLDWDWRGAERCLSKARMLSPGYDFSHHGYAIYCAAIGETEQAVVACKKALDLDPLSPHVHTYLGMFLLRAGLAEEAIQEFDEALELEPDQPQAHWLQGQALVLTGRHEEGIQRIEEALKLSCQNPMILAGLGWAYGVTGRRSKACRVLENLKDKSQNEHVRPYLFAKVLCGMGKMDEVFEWLERAFEERDRKLAFISTDETFASLSTDARFKELLGKMGLIEQI